MKSMTGFGRSEMLDKNSGINFSVEVSTVNRKQLEVRATLPREMNSFEPAVRKMVAQKLKRGSVNLRVETTCSAAAINKSIVINEKIAAAYVRKAQQLQDHLDLSGTLNINEILNLPGVIDNQPPNFEHETTKQYFEMAVNEALDNLVTMRSEEGQNLYDDLLTRINHLDTIVTDIEPLTTDIPKMMKEKLLQKLKDADLALNIEDDRVLREIIIYSDKTDVSEELTRLKSHFEQFKKIMNKDDEAIGRSLDFLTQELHREITTLGNKASGTETSPLVVQFKTELEKIREQVQNVE